MKIEFDSKPVYGDNDKYIKTKKIYTMIVSIQIFKTKIYQKKKHHGSGYQ